MRSRNLGGTGAPAVDALVPAPESAMPDQFITVTFPEVRTALSGGNPVGLTNQVLQINAGTHTFTLDGAQNYVPPSQQVVVSGTNVIMPMEIVFTLAVPPSNSN
jgi:hypothetical protein